MNQAAVCKTEGSSDELHRGVGLYRQKRLKKSRNKKKQTDGFQVTFLWDKMLGNFVGLMGVGYHLSPDFLGGQLLQVNNLRFSLVL
jgi:hypothetical protein